MKKLTTYEVFRDLARPVTVPEYERLEQSPLKFGCRHPIITWGDIIIDGHKRYAICRKHNISFAVDRMNFDSLAEAKIWACDYVHFIAECRVDKRDDEPVKSVARPMLELPPAPVVRFRKVWDIDTMAPADVKEFFLGLHERFGHDYLKELVFVLFARIVRCQDKESTRLLFQQLYNLHYTSTFSER